MEQSLTFTARVISGAGRGKRLGTPTMNMNLADVPHDLAEGIYVCRTDGESAVMHYGPRPVFRDTTSCEVHLLDRVLERAPDTIIVEVIHKLRDVRDFPSPEALMAQIADDIAQARGILAGA